MAEQAAKEGWTQDQARGYVRALRLDRQLLQIARRARELLELLSTIDPSRIPPDAAIDLNALRRRIMALSRAPILPSIAEAQKVAGVNPDKPVKQRRTRLRIE